MTDANPFDDLSDVDSEPEQSTEESRESPSESSTEPADSQEASSDPASGPSFDYSEVRQRPLYARGETWDEFEDAIGISVVPELRRQGIRDEEKREIHDAVLTLAAEEPERLVEIIAERREP